MPKKPGIPSVATPDPKINSLLIAIKENIELITGARPGISELTPLTPNATNAEIVSKINEIVSRLNASG
jgi:hypothetical protein